MHVQECKEKKLIMDGWGGSLDNFWVWWSNTFSKGKLICLHAFLHCIQSTWVITYTVSLDKQFQMLTYHVWASSHIKSPHVNYQQAAVSATPVDNMCSAQSENLRNLECCTFSESWDCTANLKIA